MYEIHYAFHETLLGAKLIIVVFLPNKGTHCMLELRELFCDNLPDEIDIDSLQIHIFQTILRTKHVCMNGSYIKLVRNVNDISLVPSFRRDTLFLRCLTLRTVTPHLS